MRQRERTFAGGDSGAVIEPRNADASLLWQRVAADEMPPKHPLSDDEKALLRRWIESASAAGAPIRSIRFAITTATRAGTDWWSLQPLSTTHHCRSRATASSSAIRSIGSSPRNLRRPDWPRRRRRIAATLIRRLSFDLTGLPPTPDEVDAFRRRAPIRSRTSSSSIACSPRRTTANAGPGTGSTSSATARATASSATRGGRTPGTIATGSSRALNADLPYDEFCRCRSPATCCRTPDPDDVIATGFLVAGVHNTVLGNDQMRAVARQDELEDLVGNVAQTFLGLTVNCARCHDHKFDPIAQVDYYRLSAALGGVQHGERHDRRRRSCNRASRHSQRRIEIAAQRTRSDCSPRHGRRCWQRKPQSRRDGRSARARSPPGTSPRTGRPVGDVDFTARQAKRRTRTGRRSTCTTAAYFEECPARSATQARKRWKPGSGSTVSTSRAAASSACRASRTANGSTRSSTPNASRPAGWPAAKASSARSRSPDRTKAKPRDAVRPRRHRLRRRSDDHRLSQRRAVRHSRTGRRARRRSNRTPSARRLPARARTSATACWPARSQQARLYDAALTPEQVRMSALTGGIIGLRGRATRATRPARTAQRADRLAADIGPLEEQHQRATGAGEVPDLCRHTEAAALKPAS